jgi:hypothetical protein
VASRLVVELQEHGLGESQIGGLDPIGLSEAVRRGVAQRLDAHLDVGGERARREYQRQESVCRRHLAATGSDEYGHGRANGFAAGRGLGLRIGAAAARAARDERQ